MIIRFLGLFALLTGWYVNVFCQQNALENKKANAWVDSVFNSLSQEERIAQLLMIRAHSDKGDDYSRSTLEVIKKYNVGGVCFFQGGPLRQAKYTNLFQQQAKTPLLVAIDGEWGLSMRLDSTPVFPKQITLGAIDNPLPVYEMGLEIGRECRLMGIHINFAPVADVNNNPKNPVINFRSFGQDPKRVALLSVAYAKGLQDAGVLACAKHFPGHGNTDSDSHYTLPIVNDNRAVLDSIHLKPFKTLIDNGIGSIMIAHLFVPALDTTRNQASSLSKKIVTGLLKEKMGFNGLIVTDALEMEGVAGYFQPGEIEVRALEAGNDLLLLPSNVPQAIRSIQKAIKEGRISQEQIDMSCKKVLALKYWAGLNTKPKISIQTLFNDLNSKQSTLINQKCYQSAITVIQNQPFIPLQMSDSLKLATVAIGKSYPTDFQKRFNEYFTAPDYYLPQKPSQEQCNQLINKLNPYNQVIVCIHNMHNSAKSQYNVSGTTVDFINRLSKRKKVVLVIYGNPYSLSLFNDCRAIASVVCAYQDNSFTQMAAAEVLAGGKPATGKLPVTASSEYLCGEGVSTAKTRLGYALPEEFGISEKNLSKIDSIALDGIASKAFPGCQVLIAVKGDIIYRKSFGTSTYDSNQKVDNESLYDIASVTKIAATTLAVMKLFEEKKIDIDKTLGFYLDFLKGSNKENLIIREVMAHQARLKSWIPFYKETLKNGNPDPSLYKQSLQEPFTIKVADNLFLNKNWKDSIMQRIAKSDLRNTKTYLYSDLGFLMLKEIIEKVTGQTLNQYCTQNFYKPLGLLHTSFNPLEQFDRRQIMPTENDTIFRKQVIWGYVHDPSAAMLGGVSGNAGLFSDAYGIAVIMQMLLNEGKYGGKEFFKSFTVKEFTRQQFPLNQNRRGLGFDKPLPNHQKNGPVCSKASNSCFGHTGFTGTCAWVDPEYQLVFVFLSNRVYPDAENKKIQEMDIREKMQEVIYDLLTQVKSSTTSPKSPQ